MHWSGSIVPMEAITLEEDQSCQALNAAWIAKTAISTHARAKFATAGGCPRGFQAMKTRIPATRRIEPKPPKKYPIIRPKRSEGGGVILFLPFSPARRFTCSSERPWDMATDRRRQSSSGDIVCHWRSARSTNCQWLFTSKRRLFTDQRWPSPSLSSQHLASCEGPRRLQSSCRTLLVKRSTGWIQNRENSQCAVRDGESSLWLNSTIAPNAVD
jgi:hypothetical protein